MIGVLPADEDVQPYKTSSIHTNVVVSLSIQWLNIASKLYFPFDNSTEDYLEYEETTTIKQVDVILLQFPLMWSMSDVIRQNDLLAYEHLTCADEPAMT